MDTEPSSWSAFYPWEEMSEVHRRILIDLIIDIYLEQTEGPSRSPQ